MSAWPMGALACVSKEMRSWWKRRGRAAVYSSRGQVGRGKYNRYQLGGDMPSVPRKPPKLACHGKDGTISIKPNRQKATIHSHR